MSIDPLLAAGLALALVVAVVIVLRQRRSGVVVVTAAPPSADVDSEVRELLARGQKIEAIKRVRERTDWGLKQAKDYVEALEAGRGGQQLPDAPAAGTQSAWPADGQVRELLARGQKIEAIKLVRQLTGLGLKEAKDYVDALEAGRPTPPLPAAATPAAGGPPDDAELRALIARGLKIQAIKVVRERTGLGLKEAKDYVDELERRG